LQASLMKVKDRFLLIPYVFRVFPEVERSLAYWRGRAADMPDAELSAQALASIAHKRFHCQGGSVYALYNGENAPNLVPFIVALQTISDYLDNLCDRSEGSGEAGFSALHGSMEAAVDPSLPLLPWYRHYPHHDDGGYLDELVADCRLALTRLPGYGTVAEQTMRLALLYSDLQVYKHLHPSVREERLKDWFNRHGSPAPGIRWWEFAAACGSTLGIFALTALSAQGPVGTAETEALLECYFPWLCGLHILLDYFIDLDEDSEHGDLNFVSYYSNQADMEEGLLRFLEEALMRAGSLSRPAFHTTVIKGMLAMYLSDPKAYSAGRKKTAQRLLRRGGKETAWMHRSCLVLRQRGIL
jgi:tetraprenyl-beta-curcumene synthase